MNKNNQSIEIKGAKMHNLKNIDVSIPKNKLTAITGVSGSGKSSLAFDTLFAEGQRRYAESLNSYVRQFVSKLPKPEVDYITNLCPAISIEQKVISKSSRSTVGTLTEIYDYLKLLFARIGKTYSPISGEEVTRDTNEDLWNYIKNIEKGERFLLLFKYNAKKESPLIDVLSLLLQQGYVRIFDGETKSIFTIEDLLNGENIQLRDWYVIMDRGVGQSNWSEEDQHRWMDSIENCNHEGSGISYIFSTNVFKSFDENFSLDNIIFEKPSVDLFSFNNSFGACKTCEGFGNVLSVDEDLVIPDRSLSIYEGAVACWKGDKQSEWQKDFIKNAAKNNFPIHKPIKNLTQEQYHLLWNGDTTCAGILNFFTFVNENLYKVQYRVLLSRYRGKRLCSDCEGTRIRKDAMYVKIYDKSISDLLRMSCLNLNQWFDTLTFTEYEQTIAKRLLNEIKTRLKVMIDIGLEYLQLARSADTLSGGESQRIQLTRMLGSNLSESLYVLDEPSIGLHPRDTMNLVKVLRNLQNLGNTVVVVEHEEMIIKSADHVIDIGPEAGNLGGRVVAEGPFQNMKLYEDSLTEQYLLGKKQITRQFKAPKTNHQNIILKGCEHHNLKDFEVRFKGGVLNVVSGVSGSGKSTLVAKLLYPAICEKLQLPCEKSGRYKELVLENIDFHHVQFIDQNPIGLSSRSNPVTYIKAYDDIRLLFSGTKLSAIRGYLPKDFSFNVDGGRCDTCKGEGEILVQMQFLADIHLPCESCNGKRFKEEVLEITYQQKNIFDILQMTVDESIEFFKSEKKIIKKLEALQKVGLGYIQLGQSSSTHSGGEAQRVKLATYLLQNYSHQKALFIFDEPTTGLHFHDIQKLLNSFDELLENGHTIVVIEHNLDVIKLADWNIDLGPEGGDMGGELIFEGTFDNFKKIKHGETIKYL